MLRTFNQISNLIESIVAGFEADVRGNVTPASATQELKVTVEDFLRSNSAYRVLKEKGQTTILVNVAGCTPKDVQVRLDDEGLLHVDVACKVPGMQYTWNHKFRVGAAVDASSLSAEVTNGILTVVARKSPQRSSVVVPVKG